MNYPLNLIDLQMDVGRINIYRKLFIFLFFSGKAVVHAWQDGVPAVYQLSSESHFTHPLYL